MRATIEGSVVRLYLSRRNCLALLDKVADPSSMKTLIKEGDNLDQPMFVVIVEPDDVHYGYRDYPPGPMTPQTEEFIAVGGCSPDCHSTVDGECNCK